MIIGLTGPIGSGKDTIANLLCAEDMFVKLKFADPLYAMASALDSTIRPDMPHAAKQGYLLNNAALGTRRNFMEKLGTEFARKLINEDFWLLAMHEQIQQHKSVGLENIVISDVRFDNEADYIRAKGGHIVHLKPDWPIERTGHISDVGITYRSADSLLGLKFGQPQVAYMQLKAILMDVYEIR